MKNKIKYAKKHYPKCYAPIGVAVGSVVEPKKRLSINEWFEKFTPKFV